MDEAPPSPDPLQSPELSPSYPQSPTFDVMHAMDDTQPMPERSVPVRNEDSTDSNDTIPYQPRFGTAPLPEGSVAVRNEDSNDSHATVTYDHASLMGASPVFLNEDSNATLVTFYNGEDSTNFTATEDSSSVPDVHPMDSSSVPVVRQTESSSVLDVHPTVSSSIPDARPTDTDEPPAKIRKISPVDDDQDGETCPICLDAWGSAGEHRPAALRCGHVFGARCVQRWLRAQPLRDRSCPTCKTKAHTRDLRLIYARKLVAADTSEIIALQKLNETLQAEKCRVELELQKTKIAHRACLQQLDSMRSMLARNQVVKTKRNWRFALEKNLEVSKDGGCRVCSYNCRTYELYVSQKSTNNLFPGYGVRRISCLDYKLNQFIHLHTKPIRDIVYSQPRDLFLSVSLDKTFRLVERGVPTMNVETAEPLWSCSWDHVRPQEFYIGGFRGIVYHYDIRNTGSILHRLVTPLEDKSQIISLCSTEHGLLTCSINSSWLWVPGGNGDWEPKSMPVDGPFMPICYDYDSNRAAITCRPKGGERSKVVVCKMDGSVNGETSCNVENVFLSSATASCISRSTWVKAPGSTWVAGYSESDSSIHLHGLEGARSLSLPSAEAALDLCAVQLNSETILAALSETRVRLYKAVPT